MHSERAYKSASFSRSDVLRPNASASFANVDSLGFDGPLEFFRPDARAASISCTWFFDTPA